MLSSTNSKALLTRGALGLLTLACGCAGNLSVVLPGRVQTGIVEAAKHTQNDPILLSFPLVVADRALVVNRLGGPGTFGEGRAVYLCLGYTNGFQVWDVSRLATSAASARFQEVLSVRTLHAVRIVHMLEPAAASKPATSASSDSAASMLLSVCNDARAIPCKIG